MKPSQWQFDLAVVAADLDTENALIGILNRRESLGIRPVRLADHKILRHPQRDCGYRSDGYKLLRSYLTKCQYALVVFDYEGSGCELDESPESLEQEVEGDLSRNGWEGRCAAIVINPELENWVWTPSPHLAHVTGWPGSLSEFMTWVKSQGYQVDEHGKPSRPKEAFLASLKHSQKPPSSSLYQELASKVSLRMCSDRAFNKLRKKLQEWFPIKK